MVKEKSKQFNTVRFLALCPLAAQAPNGGDNNPSRVKMHRVLKKNQYYKFTSDFEINKEKNRITLANTAPKELYEIHQKNGSIWVNVSAIVGENGSGKSTIIDYIIRIINNLSAVLFGEYYYNSSSEHLHYIKNVYAELYVLVDQIVYGIICNGQEMSILQYVYNGDDGIIESFEKSDKVFRFNKDANVPYDKDDKCIEVLSAFCFTIIVNFSLYSFDSNSYIGEFTDDEKELIICKRGNREKYTTKNYEQIKNDAERTNKKNEYFNAKSWLPGILEKYDSYQVPLLITPFRKNGQVDQRKEYSKGKEKVLSLALLRNEMGNRYFTQINNKETIDKITLSLDPEYASENYMSIFKGKIMPNFSQTVCLALFNLVRNAIKNKFDIVDSDNKYIKVTWYYVVKKFFNIIFTYPEFKECKELINKISSRLNIQIINEIKNAVEKVCDIHSHVTRHFMRGIAFLKFELLPADIIKDTQIRNIFDEEIPRDFDIDDYSKAAYEIIKSNSVHIHYVDELMPPPIFNIDFKLFSKEDNDKKNVIPFETLSSGEKQITLSLSTIYYYLSNLDSTSDKGHIIMHQEDTKKDNVISYSHVCVFFDELELYYHPEMQRTFVNRLLSGLKQLEFKNIKSIQFIMATHSPFILSDVSKTNVLFLDRDGHPQDVDNMRTFGANIHTMLKHSFFLKDGTIGAFAKKVIGEVEACLKIYKLCFDNENKEVIVVEDLKELKELIIDETGSELSEPYKLLEPFIERNNEGIIEQFHFSEFNSYYSKARIRATIDLFDEPIIKKVLLDDYYEIFPDDRANEELIVSLERQLIELKNTVQLSKNGNSAFLEDLISQIENKLIELKYE